MGLKEYVIWDKMFIVFLLSLSYYIEIVWESIYNFVNKTIKIV